MEDSPRRSRIRLDSVNRISDRLLQGWTLLSEGCPDCSVPLLRKASAPQTWCVNCEASFLDGRRLSAPGGSGGGAAVAQQHQEQRQPQGACAQESQPARSIGSGAMDTYDDPTADARLGPFARRSAAPSPTPANRGSTPPIRQAPGEVYSLTPGGRPVPLDSPPTAAGLSLGPAAASQGPSAQPRLPNGLAPDHRLQSFGTLTSDEEDAMPHSMNGSLDGGVNGAGNGGGSGAADRAAAAARRAESDRISAALGQKMLQGWAMLDAYCPVCNTPLVRSRDGRLFCVGCDMEVVRQGGRAATTGAAAAPPAAAAAPPTLQPAAPSAAGRAPGSVSHAATAAARLAMYESAAAPSPAAATHATQSVPASAPAATPSTAAAAPDASDLPRRMHTSAGPAATPAASPSTEHTLQFASQQSGASPAEVQSLVALLQHEALAPEAQRLLATLQQRCELPQAQPPSRPSLAQPAASERGLAMSVAPPMVPEQLLPQQWRPKQHAGSPKRGTNDRSPPSGSPANSERRKRERIGGSQEAELRESPNRIPEALAAAAAATGPSGHMTSLAISTPLSAPGHRRTDSFGRPVSCLAGATTIEHGAAMSAGPADMRHLSGPDTAAAIVNAARNTLLTKMHETEQQLAATPGSDVEAVGRLAVLLGQQADALAALRRSL